MRAKTSDYLLENARDTNVALRDAEAAHTYGALRDASARLVGELLTLGLTPGARVGILGQNSLFWAAAYLATMKLGMIAVPFPTMLTPDEIGRYERWVDCAAVFFDNRQRRKFGGCLRQETRLIDETAIASHGPSEWPLRPSDFDPSLDAALMFTSGTTTRPKAAFPRMVFVHLTVHLTTQEKGLKTTLKNFLGRQLSGYGSPRAGEAERPSSRRILRKGTSVRPCAV